MAQGSFHVDLINRLTAQLQDAWGTIAAVLAGRIKMIALSVQDGDIIVVSDKLGGADGKTALSRAAERLHQILRAQGLGVTVLVMPEGWAIDQIDPELLEEQGWQRPQQSAASPPPTPESAIPTL